jgi:DNA-binding LacI/PurR family transcriptional regulator
MTSSKSSTPPTLEHVAQMAGVSRATVSRVVNNQAGVNPQARARTKAALEKSGYVPHQAARGLATGRTGSIALVIREPEVVLFENPFFGRLVRGVSVELARADKQLVVMFGDDSNDDQRLERYLTARHVDGVIFASLHGSDLLPARLLDAGIAVVLAGRPLSDTAVSYVDVDNVGGAQCAVRLLLEQGHRTIAMINGPSDMTPSIDRLAGYKAALRSRKVAFDRGLVISSDFTDDGGAQAMLDLLQRRPNIDAVFAANDNMAIGAMGVLRLSGRLVPGDVAVVGFDDQLLARLSTPTLTSVRQPIERLGKAMVQLLLAQIELPRVTRIVLPTELIQRGSTSA